MPQLMPLNWCFSVFVVLFLMIIIIVMYYESEDFLKELSVNVGVNSNWSW